MLEDSASAVLMHLGKRDNASTWFPQLASWLTEPAMADHGSAGASAPFRNHK